MKYLSLFSGIGTAEKGIEQGYERYSGINRTETSTETDLCRSRDCSVADREWYRWQSRASCIGYAEIDRFASSIYKYHWPDVRNYGDATTIIPGQLPAFDFLVGGFPCQSFSIAGKRQGFNEARGTLFFEIARILSHCRPRHFLLENVKGLLSSRTMINMDRALPILVKEIQKNIWERKFTPMSNYDALSDNSAAYLAKILPCKWVFPNTELDISSKDALVANSALLAANLEDGLKARLSFLATKLLPITKNLKNYKSSGGQTVPLGLPDEDLDLSRVLSSLIENFNTTDIPTYEKVMATLSEVEIMLNAPWEDLLNPRKWYTTLTGTSPTIGSKTCLYVMELLTLVSIIKQWKLSGNFWSQVTSTLTAKPGDTFYVKTFNIIISILTDIGYRVEWTVLNSKHYGVPQNRERVFIIGHPRNGSCGEVLSFGDGDGEFDEVQRETGSERQWLSVDTESPERDTTGIESGWDGRERYGDNGIMQLNNPTHSNNRVYAEGGTRPALNTAQGGNRQPFVAIPVLTPDRPTKRQNGRRFKENGDDAFTLTSQDRHGVMVRAIGGLQEHQTWRNDGISPALTEAMGKGGGQTPMIQSELTARRIRRLTPTECCRLQGLPDNWCDYGIDAKGNVYEISDSQKYKTLGNAMTVNVVQAMIERMINKGCL